MCRCYTIFTDISWFPTDRTSYLSASEVYVSAGYSRICQHLPNVDRSVQGPDLRGGRMEFSMKLTSELLVTGVANQGMDSFTSTYIPYQHRLPFQRFRRNFFYIFRELVRTRTGFF